MEDTKLGASDDKDDAGDVAREGYEALMAGKDHVVAGSFKNRAQALGAKLMPQTTSAQLHRKQSEPGSGRR
jgi:short-subunit dehydrogenase